MLFHYSALNLASAFVFALDYSLGTVMRYVLFHVIEREHYLALEQTLDNPEGTFFIFMPLKILSQNPSTSIAVIVWARYRCIRAGLRVFLYLSLPHDVVAVLIRTGYRQFED